MPSHQEKHVRLGQTVVSHLRRQLEQDTTSLAVALNPAARVSGERLHLAFHTASGSGDSRVDVRIGPAVQWILTHAQTLTSVSHLREGLLAAFEGAPDEMIDRFLTDLINTGVLVTDLAPSAFDTDPARRLVEHSLEQLDELIADIDAYAGCDIGDGRAALTRLQHHLESTGAPDSAQHGLQVDLHLDISGQVPAQVQQAAPGLLDALCRLTAIEASSPTLRDHVGRFLEKFGDCEVPLLQALDPLQGIGMPAGYPTSELPPLVMTPSPRPRLNLLLAATVERARRESLQVVDLRPEDVADLPLNGRPPASADLFIELSGSDDAPSLSLGPVGAAFPAGRSTGRFAGKHPELVEHMRQCSRHDAQFHQDTLLLELEYLTPQDLANNVALAPSVYDHQLILTRPGDSTTTTRTIHDLLLGVDSSSFYLRDVVTGRRVLTRRSNLVTGSLAADVVRFLEEVSDDGIARPSWSWGQYEGMLDFYPGVTYQGITLSPAKWRVDPRVKTAAALTEWLSHNDIPRFVYSGHMDNRLLLDSTDPVHVDLMLREVQTGNRYIHQAPAPHDLGFATSTIDGSRHATEVVASVLRPLPEPLPAGMATRPPAKPIYDPTVTERFVSPGDPWWYFDIFGPDGGHHAILRAFSDDDRFPSDAWFFIRYSAGGPHLRMRFRADDITPATVSQVLTRLRSSRLVSTWTMRPYEREIERYGGMEILRACEQLWCTESALIARHECLRAGSSDSQTSLAQGVTLLAVWVSALGYDASQLHEILTLAAQSYRREFPTTDAALRKAVRTVRPAVLDPALTADLESHLRPHLSDISVAIRFAEANQSSRCASGTAFKTVDRWSIEMSLLHMWCNRLGYGREQEYQLILGVDQQIRADLYRTLPARPSPTTQATP